MTFRAPKYPILPRQRSLDLDVHAKRSKRGFSQERMADIWTYPSVSTNSLKVMDISPKQDISCLSAGNCGSIRFAI